MERIVSVELIEATGAWAELFVPLGDVEIGYRVFSLIEEEIQEENRSGKLCKYNTVNFKKEG